MHRRRIREVFKLKNRQEIMENKKWFDKYYKFLMLIPIIFLVFCFFYLTNFYNQNNDVILKDSSLSGGTVITLNGDFNYEGLESYLKLKFEDISFRKLTDLRTGKITSFIIETPKQPEEIKPEIETFLGITLNGDNSSTEFTGPTLSANFYKQLIMALIMSFVLMSIVILLLFRTFVPSISMIFAVFSNMVIALTLVNIMGLKISGAGIAAFLMLIGYSVDTNILLTTRALKKKEGTLNERLFGAFKVGIFMTLTALFALLPAFFIITNLPDSFRQIFLILSLGLFADIFNTWLVNLGIIKWYCEKKGIR
jgi:preprotein translocase subunit SecF